MKPLAVLSVAVLAGCSMVPSKLFTSSQQVEVKEVARSLYCNSASEASAVQILPDMLSVLEWQKRRGVTLAATESLAQAPYAMVEMGTRPTGGYGLAVSRAATVTGETIVLSATFVSPPAGSMRTQALSSPCALVQLPKGRYTAIEVRDPSGELKVSGGLDEPAAPAAMPAPVDPAPAAEPAPAEPAPAPDKG